MKINDCSIVQDLLPLYIEEMLQPDTVEYVEDHLSGCQTCTAALVDLKTETAAPVPGVEEIRQGNKNVLKSLKKSLTQRNAVLLLTVIYVLLYLFPWFTEQQDQAASNFLLIFFVFFPLYFAIAMFFRRDSLSRNTALAVSGAILPVAGLPLFLFIGKIYPSLYDALYGHNGTGLYPYKSLWEWFTATFSPALFLVIICGTLLTVISLRSIWSKVPPPQIYPATRVRLFRILMLCLSGLIIALHCVPWIFIYHYRSYGRCPLEFGRLSYTWIPLYITTAAAFCQVTSRKQAIFATTLALALPGYLYCWFLSPRGRILSMPWNFPEPGWFYPFSPLLLLGFYCLLSATAICSVWYQLIHQTKTQQKCRLEESHETK